MAESSTRDKLDRAIDFSLGLLSDEEELALLQEAARDPQLESLMQQQCAARARARAEGTPVHGAHRNFRSPVAVRPRILVAASVLAASLALFYWLQPMSSTPELYWLPANSALSVQRSPSTTQPGWRRGVELYEARELDAAIEVLEGCQGQGASLDICNLYLASALLNSDRAEEALRVLQQIDGASLPHPWRGYNEILQRRSRAALESTP